MEPKTIIEEQERDHALYYVDGGEPGFSPAYNKMVIERTMRKALENRKRKQKDYIESVRERADAVATYLKSRAAEANTPVEKYFSKRELAYLRGEKIAQKLQRNNLGGKPQREIYIPGN